MTHGSRPRCTPRATSPAPRPTERPAGSATSTWWQRTGSSRGSAPASSRWIRKNSWRLPGGGCRGVDAANRALRLAQMARQLSASLHARHLMDLDGLPPDRSAAVHRPLLEAPERTLAATLRTSALPEAVASPAWRRFVRPSARLARLPGTDRGQRQEMLEQARSSDGRHRTGLAVLLPGTGRRHPGSPTLRSGWSPVPSRPRCQPVGPRS